MSGIAAACGTTVEAIRAANPGLGWWLYAGQVLYIPMGYTAAPAYYQAQTGGSTYVVQWGDTLGDIAIRYGVSLSDILAVNPQIWNASLIFPGQVINLPALVSVPPSTYYPSTYYPSTYYPSSSVSSQFSVLKITYGHGLLVRARPGKNYSRIRRTVPPRRLRCWRSIRRIWIRSRSVRPSLILVRRSLILSTA